MRDRTLMALTNDVRAARNLLNDADGRLHGIFGIPSDSPERARRWRVAEGLKERARVLLNGAVLTAERDEAIGLLREVSAANNDGEGGHEDLWDAVDAFVAALPEET